MTLSFMELMILVSFCFVSSLLTLGGVFLGGYLVYMTKKEDGSALFAPLSRQEGDAYIAKGEKMDDVDDMPMGTNVTEAYDGILTDMNKRFLGQIGGKV